MVTRPAIPAFLILAGLLFLFFSTTPLPAQNTPVAAAKRVIPPATNPPLLALDSMATRGGNRYTDCAITPRNEAACHLDEVVFDRAEGLDGKISQAAHRIDLSSYGPGLSLGNMGGWRVNKVDVAFMNLANRGIAQAHSLFLQKHASGDTMGSYNYVYSDGGSTALSDESIKGDAIDMGETTGYFHGSIAATTGTGDVIPELDFLSGNDWTTDGAPLLDISKGNLAGHILGPRTPVAGTYLNTFLVDNDLPLSTAWGVCDAAIPNNNLVQKSQPFFCNVTLKAGSFIAGATVCISGPNYPEQARVTTAAPPRDGRQTITIDVRNPNGPGAQIFQGGVCGQYISFDANLDLTGYRSSYYAFGAVEPHQLVFGYNLKGGVIGDLPMASEAERFGVPGRDGYHLYPGCEVVTNQSLRANPVCEPNSVPWAVGDVVEAPHNVAVNTVGHFVDLTQNTPANGSLSSGDLVQFHGMGAVGANFIARRTVNLNSYTIFDRFGGRMTAPDMHRVEGYFATGLSFSAAPGALIKIYGNADRSSDAMTLFSLPGGEIKWDPATSTLILPAIQTTNQNSAPASGMKTPYASPLRGTTRLIGGSLLALGSCATAIADIPGASFNMVPVTVASSEGAPGFSAQGGFQVSAQVSAPDQVMVSVCAVIAGTPKASQYLVALH